VTNIVTGVTLWLLDLSFLNEGFHVSLAKYRNITSCRQRA